MNGPICAEGTGVVVSSPSVMEWRALGKWEAKASKGGWKQGKRGYVYLWASSWWYMIKAVKTHSYYRIGYGQQGSNETFLYWSNRDKSKVENQV